MTRETDATSGRARRRWLTAAAPLVVFAFAWSASMSQVRAQEAPVAVFHGSLPADGGSALISIPVAVDVDAIIEALRDADCDVSGIAITRGGSVLPYVVGAPEFVNERFPATLPAGAVSVRCARPPSDVPDVHLLGLVTKDNPLPADFVPDDLVALPTELIIPGGAPAELTEEAAEALREMLDAAAEAGHDIRVRSAYRSYAEQLATYDYWVRTLGVEEADRRSAKAGHSEHQLGVVVDVASASVGWELEPDFGQTPEGSWVARHAWSYGFAESYPEGAEAITGYAYEPWHLRYIGRTHAEWWHLSGLTLTEYLTAIQ